MTGNEKITQAVKETLSGYEPSFDATGWIEMERRLDAIPKAPAFKWTFSLNTVVGTTVLAGGLLAAYLIGGSSSMDSTASNRNLVQPAPVKETVQAPVQTKNETVIAPVITEEQAILNEAIAENPVIGEALKNVEESEKAIAERKTNSVKRSKKSADDPSKKNSDSQGVIDEYDFMKAQESMRLNKVATFGDQISTTQGFVKNTNEDDAIKQKAQSAVEKGNEVLLTVKKDSTLNTKIIGNDEEGKKQSKRKRNKSPQNETLPENTGGDKSGEASLPKSN